MTFPHDGDWLNEFPEVPQLSITSVYGGSGSADSDSY